MSDRVAPAASGGNGAALTLEQWIALNSEIAALARAGLPLEQGLMGLGAGAPGRLGEISRDLSERLSRGESLRQALDGERDRLPPLYRAVVEAGVRSGRLGTALESLADHARNYLELRRAIGVALLYPLMIVLLAYLLFLVFVTLAVPRFLSSFEAFRLPGLDLLRLFDSLGRHALWWAPWVPLVLVLAVLSWWRSGRARSFSGGRSLGLLRHLPGVRPLIDDSASASFAELMALLAKHEVPLPDAIRLAGDASGHPVLQEEGHQLAEAVGRGDAARALEIARRRGGMPALLGWLLGAADRQGALIPALEHAAASYRRRAIDRSSVARQAIPLLAVVVVGGLTVLVYGLALFLPFSGLLRQLSQAL